MPPTSAPSEQPAALPLPLGHGYDGGMTHKPEINIKYFVTLDGIRQVFDNDIYLPRVDKVVVPAIGDVLTLHRGIMKLKVVSRVIDVHELGADIVIDLENLGA